MTSLLLWTHDVVALLVTTADPVPDDSEVTPGPWMAILVLGLVVASALLWFSMRRHLRRIHVPGDDAAGAGATRDSEQPRRPAAGEAQHDRPADPPVS